MSFIAQRTFNKYQDKGQVGTVSRPALQFTLDNNGYVAGEELKPGYAVFLNNDDKYHRTAADADANPSIGVVHYNPHSINTPYANPAGNNPGEIIIPVDTEFEVMTQGHIYVLAGGAVKKGDIAFFDKASNKWKVSAKTGAANPMVFEESGADGDIVSLRINGQIAKRAIPE